MIEQVLRGHPNLPAVSVASMRADPPAEASQPLPSGSRAGFLCRQFGLRDA
jgi:hypothetical protein